MKTGQKVSVCYDGKWGRRVDGVITATKQARIRVKFTRWADEKNEEIETWFPRRSNPKRYGGAPHYHGKFVTVDGASIHTHLFGFPGEWYSVFKWKEKPQELGKNTENLCAALNDALGKDFES